MLKIDKMKSAQAVSAFVQKAGMRIKVITQKLQRLLDGYLEQDIDREIYRIEKAKLLSEKKSLEEQNIKLEQKQNDWLEPMKEWIKVASTLVKIARDSNLLQKKVAAKEIFGSNLRLASRAVRGEPVFPYLSALRAAESIGKISESLILVPRAGFEPARSCEHSPSNCCVYQFHHLGLFDSLCSLRAKNYIVGLILTRPEQAKRVERFHHLGAQKSKFKLKI